MCIRDSLDSEKIIIHVAINNLRPHLPQLPVGVETLIKACWAADPSERPSFDQIVDLFKSGSIMLDDADAEYVSDYIMKNPL